MKKKYTFTSETIEKNGRILHRIKALKDIVVSTELTIKKDTLGGFIENEYNLSQYDKCWVGGNACVYEAATVKGCAYVSDKAEVYGDACVYGHSWIGGNACAWSNVCIYDFAAIYDDACLYDACRIYGHAIVNGKAEIYGDAQITGDAKISEKAEIYDHAKIYNSALITGNACIYGSAQIYGNAEIKEEAKIHGTACLKEGTIGGDIDMIATNNLKETKHFTVEVFKINSDLSREKIKTIYINTDINDIDYLSFLIKQRHKLDNIPVSLKFIEEYNCYEDFMKQ